MAYISLRLALELHFSEAREGKPQVQLKFFGVCLNPEAASLGFEARTILHAEKTVGGGRL